MKRTLASEARESAGLSLEKAAKKIGICPRYLRRFEIHGGATFHQAEKLALLYQCPMDYFLFPTVVSKQADASRPILSAAVGGNRQPQRKEVS